MLPRHPGAATPVRVGARSTGFVRRLRASPGGLLVLLWIPCTLVPVSLLMAGHLLTLPKPRVDARLRQNVTSAASANPGSWFVLHVLAEDCECSQEVVTHLLARGSESWFSEKVLFIGSEEPARSRLVARGFGFESITPEGLQAKYGLEGAPLMVVANQRSEIVYSGGYSRTRWGPPEDLAIVRALTRGTEVKALPLFGCAVSQELQKRLDPFGLKYPVTRGNIP
jgi:hypothetical protein